MVRRAFFVIALLVLAACETSTGLRSKCASSSLSFLSDKEAATRGVSDDCVFTGF